MVKCKMRNIQSLQSCAGLAHIPSSHTRKEDNTGAEKKAEYLTVKPVGFTEMHLKLQTTSQAPSS